MRGRPAHSPSETLAAGADLNDLKASITSFLAAFPDLTVDVRHLVQEDDLVSVWLSYTATHEADFAGVRACGRAGVRPAGGGSSSPPGT